MGTLERRAREKGNRKKVILDAARSLFLKGSYSSISMSQIARKAELAPGTLYLYFPSKEALYAELLKEGYDLLCKHLEKRVKPGLAPQKQAEQLVDAFIEFGANNPGYFDIIFFILWRERMPIQEVCLDDAQKSEIRKHQEDCKAYVRSALEKSVSASPREIDAKVEAIWSMLAGVILYFRKDNKAVFESVAREAKHIILKGIYQ